MPDAGLFPAGFLLCQYFFSTKIAPLRFMVCMFGDKEQGLSSLSSLSPKDKIRNIAPA
jgi:hypothetical protein